jgi:Acyclic terpene utilisation family protein AtuA
MPRNQTVRVGCGAGTSDDRLEPALELALEGDIDYLVYECLAERTIARENLARSRDPDLGYTPSLIERLQLVLPACLERGIRTVSNMGAANPVGGARAARREAREMGLRDISCAVVAGDDVGEIVRRMPELPLMENGEPLESVLPRMVSANAYLGADVVRAALDTGADLVLTGRVADPSLFLGTIMHHLDWDYRDWPRLAAGTVAGHLLECSGSVTGGCFADPGKKEVPGLARLGFPYADVTSDGTVHISKVPGSGGRVDVMTCTEQLIYEMHDPANYITPDCILDITGVRLSDDGEDRVRVEGARAKPRTDTYKVTVGYFDGWIGEGEVSYAGTDAVARAQLAGEIVRERLKMRGFAYDDFRVDLIGMSSLHGLPERRPTPYEVRLRVAGRSQDRKAAHAVGFEVRTLHVNGPGSAGGGSDPRVRQVLAVKSVLLPRRYVNPQILVEGEA